MNKYLNEFYTAYLAWIERGAVHLAPFRRDTGLCTNMNYYQEKISGAEYSEYVDAAIEMKSQWYHKGLDTKLPFTPAENQYRTEASAKTAHMNPARIQWVKDRVAEFKDQ